MYDLAEYLCPANGKPYLLSSGENCVCVQCPDGWREQRKNALVEEFYASQTAVGRGADTSDLWRPGNQYTGTFYVQYTLLPDGTLRYGADWAARQMTVGQRYHRNCTIVVYDYTGKQLRRDDNVASDLVLNAHYDRKTFPSGVTVDDVLEFQWGGEERYFYAKGCGLVGWENLATKQGNYIISFNAALQPPAPHAVPRPPYQEQPPVSVYPIGTNPQQMKVNQPAGVKLRAAPSTNGTLIRPMPIGEVVTVYGQPIVPDPTYRAWQRVADAFGNNGWSAMFIDRRDSFVPAAPVPPPAPTWVVNLPVPYVSQIDSDSNLSNNDCALASLLMLERHEWKQRAAVIPSIPSVNDLERKTVLAQPAPPNGLTFAQIDTVAQQTGYRTRYISPLDEAAIVAQLDAGKPVQALVSYVAFNPASGEAFAHFVVVVGYNGTDFNTHDPYKGGANFRISRQRMMGAMQNVPGNSAALQGLVLA